MPRRAKAGPRWSIVGRSIARRIGPGTLVGPGICRKCRPAASFTLSIPSPCFRISIDRSKNTPSDRRNIRYRRCSNGQKVLEQSRSSGDESDEASSMIEGHPTISISRIIPISDKGDSASTFLYLEFLGHRVSRNIRERRKSCSFHQDETHRSLYKKLRPSFVPCHRRRLVIDASSLNHPGFPWGDGLPRPVDFALGDRFRSFRSPTAFEKTEARVSV